VRDHDPGRVLAVEGHAVKARPRVTKGPDGWVVQRPGYGFAKPSPEGPYDSQRKALESLKTQPGSAGPVIESTSTPEPPMDFYGNPPVLWPVVFR
jgi:hypothetical protein